jgi:SpoIIAA-like
MIEVIKDLPAGTIGVRLSGKVDASDYKEVLDPAIEAAIGTPEKINAMIVMESDVDMTAGATWQDTKLGLKHPLSWNRIAIVSDKSRWDYVTPVFSILMPGQVKNFHSDQENEALQWLTSE